MALVELLFNSRDDHAPCLLYSVHKEYAASISAARTPNSNFLRGAKWSPDGACLLTASDDNCLRIYDTPLEAFQLAPQLAERAAQAAAEAAADAAAATSQQAPEPAGQRVPAQPPSTAHQQQQPGGLATGLPAAAAAAASSRRSNDSLAPALRIQEGELLYDFCWYPCMSAAEPASCVLATTGRAQPVHLWDAITGELRCSYRFYNELDEVEPAHSLAFSGEGDRLFCGFNKAVQEFRVERPGRQCRTLMTYKKGKEGLPGIVSCLAANPDRSGMLAAGSYSGGAALLDSRTKEMLCLLEGGHAGGLTHLRFSACGNYLYTGARKDASILCWDVRHSSGVLYSLPRVSGTTNQRMYFDIEPCGRHLATGGEDGAVRVYDLRDGSLAHQFVAATDTVNGVAFHPFLPLLATASGQRRYPLAPSDSNDGGSSSSSSSGSESDEDGGLRGSKRAAAATCRLSADENVLRVWQCAAQALPPIEEAVLLAEVPLGEPVVGMAEEGEGAAGEADKLADQCWRGSGEEAMATDQ